MQRPAVTKGIVFSNLPCVDSYYKTSCIMTFAKTLKIKVKLVKEFAKADAIETELILTFANFSV